MDTESGKKVAKGWCCALLGYHSKITLRASQGHCKVKLAKNIIFRIFYRFQTHLRCRLVLQMTAADTLLYWSRTISPRIARGLYAISALKGYYPLDISLITPLSQSRSESTKLLKLAVCYRSLSPQDNISMDTELVMKGCMNWYHPKVTSGSYQGHWKVKLIKHDFWWIYLFQTHLG